MREECLKYIHDENRDYLDRIVEDINVYGEDAFYNGNPNVKRANYVLKWTEEMLDEYRRCKEDIHYFASKYVYIITQDEGRRIIEPWEFQHQMWEDLERERFVIIRAARQTSKTTTVSIWLTWKAIFEPEQTILLLANLANTARKILNDNIKLIIEGLPFWLQPGVLEWNKGSIEFENRTKIRALSSSSGAARGYTANICYVDEFAFIDNSEDFMAQAFPVISAGKTSKFIVTSTANGVSNEFYRIWVGATEGKNTWYPIDLPWNVRPDRDEKYKEKMISDFGILKWRQEYENEFLVSDNTLISLDILATLPTQEPILELNDGDLLLFERPIDGHSYVISVDSAMGGGLDYSAFSIFDVTEVPFKQVCTYKSNNISPFKFPDIIVKMAKMYNNAMVVVENNGVGMVVARAINYDLNYDNMYYSNYKDDTGLGVQMTRKVKGVGCSTLKDLIERRKLSLLDKRTIDELFVFEERNGTYAAVPPEHDDLVMTCVIFAWFTTTENFVEIRKGGNIREILRDDEEEVIFGIPETNQSLSEEEIRLLKSLS